MYEALTFYHNTMRWLVLAALLFAIYRAYRGYTLKSKFSRLDNATRHWTATILHIQLLIGILLYFQSPLIRYFRENFREAIHDFDITFFGLVHSLLMFAAIVLVTIGSALARRKQEDEQKFKTILVWFSIALLIILLVIPWPFSPFAHRPYFR